MSSYNAQVGCHGPPETQGAIYPKPKIGGRSSVARYPFGWLERPERVRSPNFEISPLECFDAAVSEVVRSASADDEWLEMPIEPKPGSSVLRPVARVEWPCTHYLEADPSVISRELAFLLISVFGFLHGLKLNPGGMGHLHRTPRKPGTLVEFVPIGKDVEKGLAAVINFYSCHASTAPEAIALMTAALHWYLTSQSYDHHFEKFAWQYTVLDNIHRLTLMIDPEYQKLAGRQRHKHRPVNLADRYHITLPRAFTDPGIARPNANVLAQHRNQLFHEARWIGQPLGYAADAGSYAVLRSLSRFNSQLILGTLGIECAFLKADDDRQIWPLSVIQTG
jgi:hypothetical protein